MDPVSEDLGVGAAPEAMRATTRFPTWVRRSLGGDGAGAGRWGATQAIVRDFHLETICESALCPNRRECWSHGNVSLMILGSVCTRRCAFCAVTTGRPPPVDPQEPWRVARAIARLPLRYVVITAPARDDLPDQGAGQFATTVRAIKACAPLVGIEVLTPDFHARPERITQVVEAGPDVYSHNLETVRRLTPSVRPQAQYDRSLAVLARAHRVGAGRVTTKSGIMVGLGERPDEVRTVMQDLRRVGCELLTVGQYLQPTPRQRRVVEFVPLARYAEYREWGLALGFRQVASGPYVRSSYNAHEALTVVGGSRRETPDVSSALDPCVWKETT